MIEIPPFEGRMIPAHFFDEKSLQLRVDLADELGDQMFLCGFATRSPIEETSRPLFPRERIFIKRLIF
jgi:hypothetical protein